MSETQGNPNILIVDDKPQNIYALEKLLVDLEVGTVPATSGFEALELTLEHDFCLAIVDIQMPEMDGYELVELLRGNLTTANLPVIFVSAIYSDEYHHRKGYEAGAVDFLSKPFVPEILLSKVQVFLDLYNQQRMLKDLADQNARLYEVEKQLRSVEQARAQDLVDLNASKDRFFSIVSHDLRTPFNGLIGNAQLLQMLLEDNQIDGEISEIANTILESAQTAHRLLENLLNWSMIQRGIMESHPEALNLEQLVRSVFELFASTAAQKGIQFKFAAPGDTMVFADLNMLKTILRNLISNAIKFTPAGGKVSISARPQIMPEADTAVSQFVEISIADTGVGINEPDLEKLFRIDVRHTTEGTSKESGAGLGLTLCKEMVEVNGGQISLESIPGRGTTVTLTLPMPEAAISAVSTSGISSEG